MAALSCSGCFDASGPLKILPCAHSFCWRCLVKCADRKSDLSCPICGVIVRLPPEGVRGLSAHFFVDDLLEKFDRDLQRESEKFCSVHRGEKVTIFCQTCVEAICVQCVGAWHSGHQMGGLTGSGTVTENARSLLVQSKERVQELHRLQCGIDSTIRQVDDCRERIENGIKLAARKAIDGIQRKEAELMQELEGRVGHERLGLEQERREIQTSIGAVAEGWRMVDGEYSARGRERLYESMGHLSDKVGQAQETIQSTSHSYQVDMRFIPSEYESEDLLGDLVVNIGGDVEMRERDSGRYRPMGRGELSSGATGWSQTTSMFDDLGREGTARWRSSKTATTVRTEGSAGASRSSALSPHSRSKLWVKEQDKEEGEVHTSGRTLTPGVRHSPKPKPKGSTKKSSEDDTKEKKKSERSWCSFGEKGSRNGQFNEPSGVACSKDGEMFIIDRRNKRVQVFDSEGKFRRKFSTKVKGKDTDPRGLAINPVSGEIYVTDSKQKVVNVFSSLGEYIRGFGAGVVSIPCGIAVDNSERTFVADMENHHVTVHDKDGNVTMEIGSAQRGDCHLHIPLGVALAPNGDILVTDGFLCCIKRFGPDGSFRSKFDCPKQDERYQDPRGICVTPLGDVVAFSGGGCVALFDQEGEAVRRLVTQENGLEAPSAVAYQPEGRRLVVTDTKKHNITIKTI
ncbi:PREDICTED: tripartite motif-containing protein 2-like [Branchiostoma belcheri]|uniref:RING-type E3 ubiquitin transferase n=1 Tax=Branchiostoma belcheri TaxID=7741 RepID=A0A6P4XQJ5_BRABE|nr:PREDICTED: tripartite motif-containing protein 2-like [Branchiostoma belcheri]